MYYKGSSEIQTDGLQTLYLMNPNYFGYSAATQQQPPANMLFLNSPTTTAATIHTLDSDTALPQSPLSQAQQFVGIPLSHHEYPTRPLSAIGNQEEIHTSHHYTIPRFHYHSWGSVDHQSTNGNQPDMSSPQGLSLSLSPHQTPGFNKSSSLFLSDQDFSGKSSIGLMTSSKICSSPSMSTTVSNGVNSMQHIIMGSKYRKAAQQVLYEVANVGNGINNDPSDQVGSKDKAKITQDPITSRRNFKTSSGGGDQGSKSRGPELTEAQRQEIQMKKAKLVPMLDEVEQRYRQYHHRMEMIVASFEQAAGTGSAKTYTQLAFRTISKQFRCLKDAISSQIKSLSKSLDEEGNNLGEKFEGSKLKFVDHQLRRQSALQKLGMMQNNAWRPQRGLPERAVSVLRAWLFEHFLHPYPKDSDKHMMAKQTGLTRSQVSNWFINARVRLWKPMVEEMYLEEMKNQEQINSDDPENTAKTGTNKESGSKLITAHPQHNNHTTMVPLQSKKHKQVIIKNQVTNPSTTETQIPSSTTTVTTSSIQAGVEPNFVQPITSLNMEKGLPDQNNTKKPRQDNSPNCNYLLDHTSKEGVRVNNGEFSTTSSSSYHGIGFRTHGRFSASVEQLATAGFHGNNVCLTLALPRSESSQFSGHQQNLLSNPRNFEFGTRILETGTVENGNRINGYQSSAASHANIAGYGQNILDFQNRSKPFPAQLLPDFLASQI